MIADARNRIPYGPVGNAEPTQRGRSGGVTVDDFSREACRVCGWRHQLDAFKPGDRVRVLSQHRDRGYHHADYVGCTGTVREWSQYGGPVYVRVQFADGERENFEPCELEHAP